MALLVILCSNVTALIRTPSASFNSNGETPSTPAGTYEGAQGGRWDAQLRVTRPLSVLGLWGPCPKHLKTSLCKQSLLLFEASVGFGARAFKSLWTEVTQCWPARHVG